ncbi:MAG: transposase [Ferruginibacter sp.]|nr:transposase [Cytophagales bacterium]
MKAKSRRQFTPDFKVKVVLEGVRQNKTLNQIASEHELHPQQLHAWKQAFLAVFPEYSINQREQKSRLMKPGRFTNRLDVFRWS